MSVIVKGMKMPKTCIECGWHEYYGGDYDWCHACRMTGSMPIECSVVELGRADNCPLVELPEKHGDLIDKDVLLDDLLIHADSYFADFARLWTNKQPAVIEVEDGT